MKLIIQIPCLNEAETLPVTLEALPKNGEIPGVDEIQTLVIDDGSTDGTAEIAQRLGVDHVVRFKSNRGLAAAYSAGLDASVRLGADIIVNTDGDNQYAGKNVADLIVPILEGRADMVVGDRRPQSIQHFSTAKKLLQRWGSGAMRGLSGTQIPDATSGFRALSREAAMRLNVMSDFSYTLETLIQAGKKRIAMDHVPIDTNPPTRPSRLFGSIPQFVRRSAATMLRIYATYEPLKVFLLLGAVPLGLGLLAVFRFVLVYLIQGGYSGYLQSLILGGVGIILGLLLWTVGVVADLIGANRRLIEDALLRIKRIELKLDESRSDHDG